MLKTWVPTKTIEKKRLTRRTNKNQPDNEAKGMATQAVSGY